LGLMHCFLYLSLLHHYLWALWGVLGFLFATIWWSGDMTSLFALKQELFWSPYSFLNDYLIILLLLLDPCSPEKPINSWK
jgi:hypothetical protein